LSSLLRLGLLLPAVVVAALTLAACGGDSSNQEELDRARTEGAKEAKQQAKIEQIEKELKAVRKGGPANGAAGAGNPYPDDPNGVSGGSGNCGGELSVGANTTCPFAENVQAAYFDEIGSGSGTVVVYSPVTDTTYEMYCTAGSPHVCTGGNDASVYFP
jgi:hypothetical protein